MGGMLATGPLVLFGLFNGILVIRSLKSMLLRIYEYVASLTQHGRNVTQRTRAIF